MSIKYLNISGDPSHIGFMHGSGVAQEIGANYQYYLSRWQSQSGVTEKEILDKAMTFLPSINSLDPKLVQELQGISSGSGLDFSKILALNCRWELNYAYLPDMNEADGGCTAFALTPEATRNGHTYIGQNWDYKPPLREQCLLLRIEQPEQPTILLITEAGIIGHKGFNSSGIGIGVNFIKLASDSYAPGIPLFLKVRHLLELQTLKECNKFLENNPGPNSGNILIASKEGLAKDFECNPEGMTTISPTNGVLVHSNHFLFLRDNDKDIGCILLPDTFSRTERLKKHLLQCKAETTNEAIEIGLRDHAGFPNSICRHQDESSPIEARWETLISFYVDLDSKSLWFTVGNPCHSTFEKIVISD